MKVLEIDFLDPADMDKMDGVVKIYADTLDHCNPLAIAWLNKLRTSASL